MGSFFMVRPAPGFIHLGGLLVLAVHFCICSLAGPRAFSQSLIPEIGAAGIHQRSLELRNNLRILNIALEPGYEDLPALAYFRLARGARIMTEYVSNGEGGENDHTVEYPPMIASTRRKEAQEAMTLIGGDAHFICLPDVRAARDRSRIRELWPQDSLTNRLKTVISEFKPNIILVSRDWEWGARSLRTRILLEDLARAVGGSSPRDSVRRRGMPVAAPRWVVDRVFSDAPGEKGITLPVDRFDSLQRKTYAGIGAEAAACYRSLVRQRERWKSRPAYSLVYPRGGITPKTIDAGLPAPASGRLRPLEREIQKITSAGLAGSTMVASASGNSRKIVQGVNRLIATANDALVRRMEFTFEEQNTLLQWKSGLENLRNSLIGVSVTYSLDDRTVTDRQVTTLRIDTVTGMGSGGTTEIYFPAVEQGWVVNEDLPARLPLKLHVAYRLLSPAHLEYNLPLFEYGVARPVEGNPFTFLILHRDTSGGNSFNYSVKIRFDYAPRFTVEALTPLVRAVEDERVIVRLTNHTWDGVADTVAVSDSVASSTPGFFRLNSRGATAVDTLALRWRPDLPAGDYLVPLTIRHTAVGRFAARKLEVKVDSAKRVGFITGVENSPLKDALRRIGIRAGAIDSASFRSTVEALDVVMIDRRTYSLRADLPGFASMLDHFVDGGGHLIILAQDEEAWKGPPQFPGLTLRRSHVFDEHAPLWIDRAHRLLSYPNILRDDDFNGWLFQRAYNSIVIDRKSHVSVPIKERKTGSPFLVTTARGKGNITYVDLALQPQLMNIDPGAFRLLANLISY